MYKCAYIYIKVYSPALASIQSSPDPCPLYLNSATLASLPVKCSRHNAPSRSHSITKHVRSFTSGSDEFVLVIFISNVKIIYDLINFF